MAGQHILAACARRVDRAQLEFLVLKPARAGRYRQHFGNDVEIERSEEGGLVVAALRVFAEGRVRAARIWDRSRSSRDRARRRRDTPARRPTCAANDRRGAGRDGFVVEIHVVVDVELFVVGADDAAQAPVARRADAGLRWLRCVFCDRVVPARDRRMAVQRAALVDLRIAAGAARARGNTCRNRCASSWCIPSAG